MESAALSDFAFKPNAAAHEFDEPSANIQAESGAAVFSRGRVIGLREGFENQFLLLLGDSDSRIGHREMKSGALRVLEPGANLDRDGAALGELQRIAKQVDKNLPQTR